LGFGLTYPEFQQILINQNFIANSSDHTSLIEITSPELLLADLDDAFYSLASKIISTSLNNNSQSSHNFTRLLDSENNLSQLNNWYNFRLQWADTPVARIPADVLRKLFCSFARSDQFIKYQVLDSFRDCLIMLLSKAENYMQVNDHSSAERYYLKFLLLPSVILTKPINLPNQSGQVSYRLDILNSIKDDNWDVEGLLLKDIPLRPDFTSLLPPDDELIQLNNDNRAKSFLNDGLIGRAAHALTASSLAPRTLETHRLLQEKHPPSDHSPFDIPSSYDQIDSILDVYNPIAMRNFFKGKPKKKATGNSNLRYEHIQQLMASKDSIPGNNFLDVFSRFCGFFASGKLPPIIHAIISEGSIFAIIKDNGSGIRPIVAKDTIAKSIGLLIENGKSGLIQQLEPINFSYSKSGMEKIIHAAKHGFVNNRGTDTVSLDISNAHNSVDRRLAREAVSKYQPILLPYFDKTYSDNSNLYFQCVEVGYLPVISGSGFHQGDPMANVAFNLSTLDPLKQAIDSRPNKESKNITVCYHDDMYIQDTTENNIAFMTTLIPKLDDLKLKINLNKSKVYLSKYGNLHGLTSAKDSYADLGFVLSNIIVHPEDLPLLNSPPSDECFGLEVLGTPVGSNAFIKSWLDNVKLPKIQDDFQALLRSNIGSQRKCILLFMSFCKKINNLLRTIDPSIIADFAAAVDSLILDAFCQICKLSIPSDSNAARQVKLPITMSGIGLGDNFLIRHAAFVASESVCFETLTKLINNFQHTDAFNFSLSLINTRICQYNLTKHRSISFDPFDLRSSAPIPVNASNFCSKEKISTEELHMLAKDSKLQNFLTTFLFRFSFNTLLKSNHNCQKDISRIVSSCQHGSGSHLLAIPKDLTWSDCTDEQWNTIVAFRLGLPINGIPLHMACGHCGPAVHVDPQGHHFINCRHCGKRLMIHNRVNNEIGRMVKLSGATVSTDHLSFVFPSSNHCPDMYLTDCQQIINPFTKNSSPRSMPQETNTKNAMATDFTAVFPTSDNPLQAAHRANNAKIRLYDPLITEHQPRCIFLPLVMEIYGGCHPTLRAFLSAVSSEIAAKTSIDYSILYNYNLKRLNMALAKGVADAIIYHRNRAIYSVDNTFSPPSALIDFAEFAHFSIEVNQF
jgi:DNA-directed RNA polymerase subunit RPC12/RpoP